MRNKLLAAFLLLALAMVLIPELLEMALGRLVKGDDSVIQYWGWVAKIPATLLLGLARSTPKSQQSIAAGSRSWRGPPDGSPTATWA